MNKGTVTLLSVSPSEEGGTNRSTQGPLVPVSLNKGGVASVPLVLLKEVWPLHLSI